MPICFNCNQSGNQTIPELPDKRFCGCNIHRGHAEAALVRSRQNDVEKENLQNQIIQLQEQIKELTLKGCTCIKEKNIINI